MFNPSNFKYIFIFYRNEWKPVNAWFNRKTHSNFQNMVCHGCDIKLKWFVVNHLKHGKILVLCFKHYGYYSLIIYDPLSTYRLYIYTAAHGVIDTHNMLTLNSQPCHLLPEMWVVLFLSAQVGQRWWRVGFPAQVSFEEKEREEEERA